MEAKDMVPDAAFRESFQLGCIAAVKIAGADAEVGLEMRIFQMPEVELVIQDKVRVGVFADSERKEAEAAAAAEVLRLEVEAVEAEAARIAGLPELLKEAAKKGDVKAILALLEEPTVNIDVQDASGYTALYSATMYGKGDAVACCIKEGATIDMENNNGVTPLMAAARDGFTEIVKMLLEAGADHFQVDEFGRTVSQPTQLLPLLFPLQPPVSFLFRRFVHTSAHVRNRLLSSSVLFSPGGLRGR